MNEIMFVLLYFFIIGFIYIAHRYFGKFEFFLLGILYSIISFVMCFKLITIVGLNVNVGIVFNSFVVGVLYYFINNFDIEDNKKYIFYVMVSTVSCIILLLLGSLMFPSIYDENIVLFKNLIFDNLCIILMYPVSLFMTLILSSYIFGDVKNATRYRTLKLIAYLVSIVLVDVFIGTYLSYSLYVGFDNSSTIAIDNYFVKSIIMIITCLLISRIAKIKKVK